MTKSEELKQRRKADAIALAELLYDIYKERKNKEQLQDKGLAKIAPLIETAE